MGALRCIAPACWLSALPPESYVHSCTHTHTPFFFSGWVLVFLSSMPRFVMRHSCMTHNWCINTVVIVIATTTFCWFFEQLRKACPRCRLRPLPLFFFLVFACICVQKVTTGDAFAGSRASFTSFMFCLFVWPFFFSLCYCHDWLCFTCSLLLCQQTKGGKKKEKALKLADSKGQAE